MVLENIFAGSDQSQISHGTVFERVVVWGGVGVLVGVEAMVDVAMGYRYLLQVCWGLEWG